MLSWLCAYGLVQLEGEPSPQSEVLNALEQVFIKDRSVLCYIHLSLDPEQSLPLKNIPTAKDKITKAGLEIKSITNLLKIFIR